MPLLVLRAVAMAVDSGAALSHRELTADHSSPEASARSWVLALLHFATMQVQPVSSRLGPFRTQGDTGWLFPCGVILLAAAAVGYGWIIVDIVLKRPLLCDLETHHMLMLSLLLGWSIGFLAAAVFDSVTAKVLSFLTTALVAGTGGAVLVALLYATQCTPFQMFVRQLIGF